MSRKMIVYNIDFSNIDEMILYAYGRKKRLKSRKDVEKMFITIREKIAEDKINNFRIKHHCTECYLFKNSDCKANGYCRFDKHRRLAHKSRINGCPHNNNEPCCYANESGTCFGYCYKKQMNSEKITDQKGLERSDGQ